MFCSTSFVLRMLVCSAADALVVAARFRYNSSVHFAAAVFARGKKKTKKGKEKEKNPLYHLRVNSFYYLVKTFNDRCCDIIISF